MFPPLRLLKWLLLPLRGETTLVVLLILLLLLEDEEPVLLTELSCFRIPCQYSN